MTVAQAKASLALHEHRKRRQNPEQTLHKAVADFLRVTLVPPAFFTTFPAGGGGKARGGQLKAMGLMPGMPDILVFWKQSAAPRSWDTACFFGLELKAGSSLSASQKKVRSDFRLIGSEIWVCKSIDDVRCALDAHGVPHRVVPTYRRSVASRSGGGAA